MLHISCQRHSAKLIVITLTKFITRRDTRAQLRGKLPKSVARKPFSNAIKTSSDFVVVPDGSDSSLYLAFGQFSFAKQREHSPSRRYEAVVFHVGTRDLDDVDAIQWRTHCLQVSPPHVRPVHIFPQRPKNRQGPTFTMPLDRNEHRPRVPGRHLLKEAEECEMWKNWLISAETVRASARL